MGQLATGKTELEGTWDLARRLHRRVLRDTRVAFSKDPGAEAGKLKSLFSRI